MPLNKAPARTGALRPAVFLDRDGTVIQEGEYLSDPAAVTLLPGAAQAMRLLEEAGFALVLVTNQSGIARGLFTLDEYRAVARRVDELLAREGVTLDATRFCPHHPEFSGECSCRKPATGMHRDAARSLGVDLGRSFFVGDRLTDVLPALELGGEGILVRTGYGSAEESELPKPMRAADDLLAAARLILDP